MKLIKRNNNYIIQGLKLSMANEMYLEQGEQLEVEVKLVDVRNISDKQRKFIFALCSEVEDYSGLPKELFRAQAMAKNVIQNEVAKSSMTEYSVTDANQLIEIIIDYFIENSIPLDQKILDDNEYKLTATHIYSMCLQRKCAICSKHADLHHLDAIGMGRNRDKISHIGMRMLPLCREHHSLAHNIGNKKLLETYHLTPIVIDEKLEYFIKKGTLKTWKGKSDE